MQRSARFCGALVSENAIGGDLQMQTGRHVRPLERRRLDWLTPTLFSTTLEPSRQESSCRPRRNRQAAYPLYSYRDLIALSEVIQYLNPSLTLTLSSTPYHDTSTNRGGPQKQTLAAVRDIDFPTVSAGASLVTTAIATCQKQRPSSQTL